MFLCAPYSYSSHHQSAGFKVTEKLHNTATRTAKPQRVKAAQTLQRIKAVLVTYSRMIRWMKSFRGLETHSLVAALIQDLSRADTKTKLPFLMSNIYS
jgi:hypothetical protein